MEKSEGKKKSKPTRSRSKSDLSKIVNDSFLVIEIDFEGIILTANKNFLKSTEYTLKEIKGKSFRLFYEESLQNRKDSDLIWQFLKTGERSVGEFETQTKSKNKKYFRFELIPVFGEDKILKKYLLLLTEIAAFKDKEKVQMVDRNHIEDIKMILRLSPDGFVDSFNQIFLDHFGLTPEQVAGCHIESMFAASSLPGMVDLQSAWNQVCQGVSCEVNVSILNSYEKIFYLKLSLVPVLNPEGQISEIIGIGEDVTHLMEIIELKEYQLSRLSGELAAFNEHLAIAEFDLTGSFIRANEVYSNLTQYREEELVGSSLNKYINFWVDENLDQSTIWKEVTKGSSVTADSMRSNMKSVDLGLKSIFCPVKNTENQVVRVKEIIIDHSSELNDRAEIEAELHSLKSVMAVVEFNLDGTVSNANEIFLAETCYRIQDLKGQHFLQFYDNRNTHSGLNENVWSELKAGIPQSGIYKLLTKNQSTIWYQAVFCPVISSQGKIKKIIKAGMNITGSKLAINEITEKFEEIVFFMETASSELSDNTESMSKNSSEAVEAVTIVGEFAGEVSGGIQGVASSMEQMNATVKEISVQVSRTSSVSAEAENSAKKATELIEILNEASKDIGKIIKTIGSIAQQTNLLALNATIEAARAGDAGRGFAVVASEVKELAKQTASSSDEITKKVKRIQEISGESALSMKEITDVVQKVNSYASSAASATEEQAATTEDVVRIVSESNQAVKNIIEKISRVSTASVNTSKRAENTMESVNELKSIAKRLNDLVPSLKKASEGEEVVEKSLTSVDKAA